MFGIKIFQSSKIYAFAIPNLSKFNSLYKIQCQPSTVRYILSQSYATKKDDKELPVPPKRPLSAYMLYAQDERTKVKEEFPDFKPTEIVRLLGSRWNGLSEKQKKVYQDKAEKLKKYYKEEVETFQKGLTLTQKLALDEKKEQKKKERQDRKDRKRIKEFHTETSKPQKPKIVSAFLELSVDEEAKNLPADMEWKEKFKEMAKLRSEKWRNVPEAEKKRLSSEKHDKYVKDMEVYMTELTTWMKKVWSMDKLDWETGVVTKPEIKQVLEHLGRPKRGRNAMAMFLMEKGNEGGVTIKNMKSVFDALPKSEQELYEEKSKQDKKLAKEELEKWIDQMKGQGLEDFVTHLQKQLTSRPKKEKEDKKKDKKDTKKNKKKGSKSTKKTTKSSEKKKGEKKTEKKE